MAYVKGRAANNWAARPFFYLSLLVLLGLTCPSMLHAQPPALERALADARRLELQNAPMWLTLLHYRDNLLLEGRESMVDDPVFFLHPAGKFSPLSELEATIRAYFDEHVPEDPNDHALCKFPARLEFIKTSLALTAEDFPARPDCNKYREFLEAVQPKAVTLVFPTTYLNNPASMFGHSLLRFDTAKQSKLTSYGLNYAAVTPESQGFVYAFKGVFGMYKGYLSLMPYYEKIKEYSYLESRDMWEYTLNLNEQEVLQMAAHVWELNFIYSDYYFFDENCSFFLLTLLEAARPGSDLIHGFRIWAIPSDTVRTLRDKGFIGSTIYRPSKSRIIGALSDMLPPEGMERAVAIAEKAQSPDAVLDDAGLDERSRAHVLDLAGEYLQYIYYKKKDLEQAEYNERFISILSARSKVPVIEDPATLVTPPLRPDQGHDTARVGVGGSDQEGEGGVLLEFCPACHEATDPGVGYEPGLSISLLDFKARYRPRHGDIVLYRLDILNILSLAPFEKPLRSYSWRLRAAVERGRGTFEKERALAIGDYGAGYSMSLGRMGMAYAIAQASARAYGFEADKFSLGAGAVAGVLMPVTDALRLHGQLEANRYGIGVDGTLKKATVVATYAVSKASSIRLEFTERWHDDARERGVLASWQRYFYGTFR